jgi:uncharacterized protein YndB with AHSA1/START domain
MANPLKLLKLKPTGFQFIQEVPISAPPAKVWKTLLNSKSWFHFPNGRDDGATIEPHLGGRFSSISRDGKIADLHGIVTHIEPQKLLRIQGAMGASHLPVITAMIFELQPKKGAKGTLLRFGQRTFGYLTSDLQKNYQGGWTQLFKQLKDVAEGKGAKRN